MHVADDTPDWALLARYLDDLASPAERATVAAWLAAHPAWHGELEMLRTAWDRAGDVPDPARLDAMWHRTATRAAPATQLTRRSQEPVLRRVQSHWPWPRGAGGDTRRRIGVWSLAGVVVIAAGALALWHVDTHTLRPQAIREFATPPGGRATVMLRDGSRVVLGPATRVRVPADFGRVQRAVALDGEAIFAVSHDVRHPFAVHTARALVRDVGTTFVVHAYESDSEDRIGVVEGEVAITRTPARVSLGAANLSSLRARDLARVTDSRVVVTHNAALTSLTAWAQGHIVFDETPLSDVVRELSRAFDLAITVSDSALVQDRVTAAYSDESPDQVLDDITSAIGATYERTGRTVVIHRRAHGATHRSPALVVPLTAAIRSNARG